MRAETLGQREAVVVEVGDDDRIDVTSGQRGDGREADRPGTDDERDLTGDDAGHRHVSLTDGERVGQATASGSASSGTVRANASLTMNSSPKLPGASGCWPITCIPPPRTRVGTLVTRLPSGN